MKYLNIENGKIKSWVTPKNYYDAMEFAEEVKKVCRNQSSRIGETLVCKLLIIARLEMYKHQDGTRFYLVYNIHGDIVKIEARNTFDYTGKWKKIYQRGV